MSKTWLVYADKIKQGSRIVLHEQYYSITKEEALDKFVTKHGKEISNLVAYSREV